MARGKYKRRRLARRKQHAVRQLTSQFTPPFRAPDVRTPDGWTIVDDAGKVVEHATSRDKARKRARELNKVTA